MKLKILGAGLAAMATTACVYHYETKTTTPKPNRMEFAAKIDAKAAQRDSIGIHD